MWMEELVVDTAAQGENEMLWYYLREFASSEDIASILSGSG